MPGCCPGHTRGHAREVAEKLRCGAWASSCIALAVAGGTPSITAQTAYYSTAIRLTHSRGAQAKSARLARALCRLPRARRYEEWLGVVLLPGAGEFGCAARARAVYAGPRPAAAPGCHTDSAPLPPAGHPGVRRNRRGSHQGGGGPVPPALLRIPALRRAAVLPGAGHRGRQHRPLGPHHGAPGACPGALCHSRHGAPVPEPGRMALRRPGVSVALRCPPPTPPPPPP